MSKDAFALAYSVKRMAKQRGRTAPQPAVEEAPLEALPELDALEDVEPIAKAGVDIGKLIKKHRFFGSKI